MEQRSQEDKDQISLIVAYKSRGTYKQKKKNPKGWENRGKLESQKKAKHQKDRKGKPKSREEGHHNQNRGLLPSFRIPAIDVPHQVSFSYPHLCILITFFL